MKYCFICKCFGNSVFVQRGSKSTLKSKQFCDRPSIMIKNKVHLSIFLHKKLHHPTVQCTVYSILYTLNPVGHQSTKVMDLSCLTLLMAAFTSLQQQRLMQYITARNNPESPQVSWSEGPSLEKTVSRNSIKSII